MTNFEKSPREVMGAYDVQSIMHYAPTVHGNGFCPVLISKIKGMTLGGKVPSKWDIYKINNLYRGVVP